MANYESALTGQQMDAALTEVALYNPEAWAVGTRNGVNVTSADETYHNNAKYYAQVAQSAIPGTYTAAVRWDIDQGLAGEAQEQARANISAGSSNRNLLDNPWFTVNQRSVNGTITNGQYGLDRWMAGGGTVKMATGRITLGAGNSFALQRTADPSIFNGKTVTLSVMTNDGVVESGTVVAQTGTAKTVQTTNFELCIGYTSYNSFYFYNTSASAKTVIAAKLELGSYSTLANDVPPDYKTELDKCQYYCRVIQGTSFIAVGQAVAPTVIRFPLPYVMRARPTATLTGAAQVYGQGGPLTPSALSCTGNTTQCIEISTTVSGATAGQSYMLVFSGANDKIVISADL